MNADIISMYVKLPLFKHFEQFLWHSCISIICQKIPGRSLSVMFNIIITVVKEFMHAHTG